MPSFTTRLAGAGALALGLIGSAACAQEGLVAFLMPDQGSTRYEEHDFPGFKAEMEKLCPTCKVIYQNADANVSRQQQQFNSAISQGAKAIVLDPVDSAAAVSLVRQAQSQGIKVIAYDRPVPDAKADFCAQGIRVSVFAIWFRARAQTRRSRRARGARSRSRCAR